MKKAPRIDFPVFNRWEDTLPDPIVDEVSATLKYIGYSDYGVADTESQFMIVRVQKIGNVTRTEYAGGRKGEFKFAWTDRATLSYSR